jgi:hypothetical protein
LPCELIFVRKYFSVDKLVLKGDTGSALVEAYGKYELVHVGVASFVSGNGCESTDPSGFTRTYPYVSWIKNITGT